MIEEEKAEADKRAMVAASYTAWQLGAGEKMSFPLYLKKLGLTESETALTDEQKEILIAKGLHTAERIRAAVDAGRVTEVKI
jgi:hypothetical protein